VEIGLLPAQRGLNQDKLLCNHCSSGHLKTGIM
jgi:hypothetical protein